MQELPRLHLGGWDVVAEAAPQPGYERYARALWICRVVDSCWVRVARARVYVTGMPCSRMPLVHIKRASVEMKASPSQLMKRPVSRTT